MNSIITTSEVQKNIGQISKNIGENFYIVTNNGKGKMIILPYFDGCDEFMSDYRENYEMYLNRKNLKARYKESLDSGESNLQI
jgi:predicted ATP-binding protein involved in virulence